MEDRDDAMRRARELSDAMSKNKSSKSSEKETKSLAEKAGDMRENFSGIAEKIGPFLSTKYGKGVLIGIPVFIVLVIILVVISSATSGTGSVSASSYEVTDSVLCAYETDKTKSGFAYDAYVEVTNTGDNFIYLTDAMLLVQDENENRIVLDDAASVFPAVIAPGEKGYIYNTFGRDLENVKEPGEVVTLQPSFVVKSAQAAQRTFPVDNVEISKGERGQKMTASVTNDTKETVSSIVAVAFLYNNEGRCIGISSTTAENVEAGMKTTISFDPLSMIEAWKNENIADYTIIAY